MTSQAVVGSDVARETLDDQDRGTAADQYLVDAGQAALGQSGRKVRSPLLYSGPQHVPGGWQARTRQHAADARRAVHDLARLVLADACGKQKRTGVDQEPAAGPSAQLDLADDRVLAPLGVGQGMVARQGKTLLLQQDDIHGLARDRFHAGRDGAFVIEDVALLGRQAGGRSIDAARGPRRLHVENFRDSFLARRDLPRAAAYTTLTHGASGRLLKILAFAAACFLAPLAARADNFALGLPITCAPGRDCWIANYFDRDSAPGVKDVGCGARTYDGHDGTDFALRDLKAMEAGVAVLASAPGRVKSVRDGVADVNVKIGGRQSVAGKECGNGVVMDHGGGWETQYCHMRKGSVAVRPGQDVAAGEKLGLVGLSGFTEFPHVHLTVRKDGVAVDPFDGHRADGTCRVAGESLWRPDLRASVVYESVLLFDAGLTGKPPDTDASLEGSTRPAPPASTSPALLLWIKAFGVEPGDEIAFRVVDPTGKVVFEQVKAMPERKARLFMYTGVPRRVGAWATGAYRGEAILTRRGSPPLTRSIQTETELR